MIKYISYFNLFFGIILLALNKDTENGLDLLAILPILLFNWLTLFHLFKNNLKFENWHVYVGYFCIVLSLLSLADAALKLSEIFAKPVVFDFALSFILIRTLFDISVIVQVLTAIKVSRNLKPKSENNVVLK